MHSRNNFSVLLLVLSCLLAYSSAFWPIRIVNGRPDNVTNSPYMVALLNGGVYYCAGSLITLQLVLTTAHCLEPFQAKNVNVLAGTTNIQELRQRHSVEQWFYPKAYNKVTREMDIGAVKVRTPFVAGQMVATLPLCSIPLPAGTPMRVSGWGRTGELSPTVDQLRTATMPIVRRQYCVNKYKAVSITITRTMICAGHGQRDSCSGDSGAPGVVDGQLCTVVSFGFGCARKGYPGVYVNVNNPKVRRFITNVMNKYVKCSYSGALKPYALVALLFLFCPQV